MSESTGFILSAEAASHSRVWRVATAAAKHLVLLFFALLAICPIMIVVINSFKERDAIFGNPYRLPTAETFSLVGYETVQARSRFELYYFNSLTVTVVSLALILFLGAMVAYALAEYPFPGNSFIRLFFLLGLIIPIRLGSVSLLRLIVSLHLVDTRAALILVYTAQGLPMSILVLTQFMQQVPRDLKDAGRIDGANEYRIFWLVLPLVRPAVGTVAALTVIPIWNDLWFPLILAPSESTRTVTMGAQQFMGQFANDWNAVLAALTLSAVPVLIMYFIFSKQLLHSLTVGAIK